MRAECYRVGGAKACVWPKLRGRNSTPATTIRRMPNSTPEAAMAPHRIEAPTPCASPSDCRLESHADWGFRATRFAPVLPLRRPAIEKVPMGVHAFPPPRRGTSPNAFGLQANARAPRKRYLRTTLDRRLECVHQQRPRTASRRTSLGGTSPGSTLRKARARAFPKFGLTSRSKAPPHAGRLGLRHLCWTTLAPPPAPTPLPLPAPMPTWRLVLLAS
jgi:hypothetical protein